MKILFVASKPAKEAGLQLEKEITEIQLRASASAADSVEFTFLPDLTLQQLQHELVTRQPDILHLSAHGNAEGTLALRRDGDSEEVLMTGKLLMALLNPDRPPKLVYLNACNSAEIAKELIARVPLAIGSTAPITNADARSSAVAFYECVFAGRSVREAHLAQDQIVSALAPAGARLTLFHADGIDPAGVVFHRIPRLEADFMRGRTKPDGDGYYNIILRLVGCPPCTTQVIFFTDDEDFADINADNLEVGLSHVVRGSPVGPNRVLKTPDEFPWCITGDFRLFAVGVTGDMRVFTASSTLCEALERRYAKKMPPRVRAAIQQLSARNGAGDEPAVQ